VFKMNYDYERLRKDLVEYFGSALAYNPMAIMDVNRVQNATNIELEEIARKNKITLSDYVISVKRYTL